MAMYTYNPDGLRRTKAVFGTLTQRYIWSCSSMVYECELLYPNNGTVYVYGINLISARNSSGDDIFYLYNAHGDVVQLVDGNGTIIQTYNYDAFGVEYDSDPADTNPFRYCGEYFDKETGTIYLRARYYNPSNGRFTQQDGWGFGDVNDPLSLNLYTYCMSNPILMVDINGHWPSWGQLFQAAAIVVGTVVVVAAVVATAGAAATAVGMAAGMYATALGATAATAGAVTAVATTAATVGAYAVAAGKVATAASNIGEVFTGHNVIRDDLMGGNQEAYDMLNIAIDMVASGLWNSVRIIMLTLHQVLRLIRGRQIILRERVILNLFIIQKM